MQGISIVTGTLNRRSYIVPLLQNTVFADDRIELILVDGGSTDGTVEMMRHVKHEYPRVKFIEVGQRSSYPHYMNLGIEHASHDLVCQWNDDVLLCNNWQDIFDEIDSDHDAYLFNWKTGEAEDKHNNQWLACNYMRDNGWIIINNAEFSYPQSIGEARGEIVMNYGIYKKDVFRKYGLYNNEYSYYCADGEMAMRAFYGGAKFKSCINVKVLVLPAEKRAIMDNMDVSRYGIACSKLINNTYEFSGKFLT